MSFSIKQLLFLTSVVAVCLVALTNASRPLVPPLMQMLLFAVLASMAYGAYLSTGERRAFRVGFLCWVIAMGTFGMTGAGNPYALLQAVFDRAAPLFKPKAEELMALNPFPGAISNSVLTFSRTEPPTEYEWEDSFRRVGFSIIPMIWGFIGGWVTVLVYRKRQRIIREHIASPPKP
jgi:hypothetical protein